MSTVVSAGQLVGAVNDVRNAYMAWSAGAELLPPTGYAEVTFTALGAALSFTGELLSGPISSAANATAPQVALLNLAGAYSQYQTARASGNEDAAISALLGVVANVGGLVATVPTPQARAAGTLLNLAANAAKLAWDNGWRPSDLVPVPLPPDSTHPIEQIQYDPLGNPINRTWQEAVTYRPRDPLAIDLQGDGIATVAINPGSPILFDHNADGSRTATGWLQGSDAWLVRDINGNGSIDSGRELFGVDTSIEVDGTARNATSGFEALAALDANGDQVFNELDGAYAALQLWRDLNQDGISQVEELSSLQASGIVAISLQYTSTNTDLGGGNSVTGTALVTRADGISALDSISIGADSTANNLNLADNPFYSQFTDRQPETQLAGTLPDVRGSGAVRDLRQAISLGTSGAQALGATVSAFAQAGTRDAQLALVDPLLRQWGATAALTTSNPFAPDDTSYETILNPGVPRAAAIQAFAQQHGDLFRKIIVLEQFNGMTGLSDLLGRWGGNLPAPILALLESSYGSLRESVYGALVMQTRLAPFVNAVELVIDEQGARFESSALASLMQTRYAAEPLTAMADLADLMRYGSQTLDAAGFNGMSQLRQWVSTTPLDAALQAKLGLVVDASLGGTGGGDIFLGDDAANAFSADAGNDTVDGGQGDDSLQGGNGDDQLSGGQGMDTLKGDSGQDTLEGGFGDDVLRGGDGLDVLRGGEGADQLFGDAHDDWLEGGAEADTLYGGAGNDTLDGGSGNDVLCDEGGNNVYLFGRGDGQDTIQRYADAAANKLNVLRFKPGILPSDVTVRQVYDAESGTNWALELTIAGTADKVTINAFFYGNNATSRFNPVQRIEFTDPQASAVTWGLAEIQALAFAGSTGSDSLLGTTQGDVMHGGAGADTIKGDSGNDSLHGDAGNDWLYGQADDDLMRGGEGMDQLYGDDGNDTLDGGDDTDMLDAGFGDDALTGGAGNDMLLGNNGNDTLDGGAGNDFLRGDAGNNVYLFGRGDGQDVVMRFSDERADKLNTLRFKEGVLPGDLIVKQAYDAEAGGNFALEISIAGTTDKITIDGVLYGNNPENRFSGIQRIEFSDPGASVAAWTLQDLVARMLQGTSGPDTITGTIAGDLISGLEGADRLQGEDGHDTLTGGLGNDTLYGGGGNDDIAGEADNDALYGDWGHDTLRGGDGADQLFGMDDNDLLQGGAGSDHLEGGNGDDTLEGGAGNDTLYGNLGNNVYLFGRGDGQDLIKRFIDTTAARSNVLRFQAGIAAADITLRQVYDAETGGAAALQISLAGTTDVITINSFFVNNDPGSKYNPIQKIEFADEGSGVVTWTIQDIVAKVLTGTSANDTLNGTLLGDVIRGLAGADSLRGNDGNDTLWGGLGNDTLQGDGGHDSLLGEDGNDSLDGSYGNDTLRGGAGFDQLFGMDDNDLLKGDEGNDNLDGGYGNDTLDGGVGNDTLLGNAGNNTYEFGRGDGQDLIKRFSDTASGKLNTLKLKEGVQPGDITVRKVYDNESGVNWALEVAITGTPDKITVNGFFQGDDIRNRFNPVQRIVFADGYSWDLDTISRLALANPVQPAGATPVNGSAVADKFYGAVGNDTIDAQGGDDFLFAGAGDDVLDGGDGHDAIFGEAGLDTLTGGLGNDTLSGGAGNDSLQGGLGNDVYLFNRGDGTDMVDAFDSTIGKQDVIALMAGLRPEDVLVKRDNDDLLLRIQGTTDSIRVVKHFLFETGDGHQIEQIKFADGTVWAPTDIVNMLMKGTDDDDLIYGTDGDDGLWGRAGNDYLFGRAGNDTILGGTGNDYLKGNEGDDLIDGGEGADTLIGVDGNDRFIVDDLGDVVEDEQGGIDQVDSAVSFTLGQGLENLTLTGTAAIDGTGNTLDNVMLGNSAANVLSGLDGNDWLEGGAGADTLLGGAGSDSYAFSQGMGSDHIEEAAGAHAAGDVDTIVFGPGIHAEDLLMARGADSVTVGLASGEQMTFGLNAIERFVFDGGAMVWNASEVRAFFNAAPTGAVSIEGEAKQGQVLIANHTLADLDGLGPVGYDWLRDGSFTGISGASYTLGQVDVGARLSVIASYTDGAGKPESVTGPLSPRIVNVNDAPTGGVTISGASTQGQTLTASHTLADVDGLGNVNYQWLRNGSATGIIGNHYTLGQADVGTKISVSARYTDGQGTAEAITSAQTGTIANINDAPAGGVTITGAATQGHTLTASNTLADADGLGSISYQWLRNGTATGVTGTSYTLGQVDVGAKLSVTASYTDGQGAAEVVTSSQTGTVANINDAPTGGATITGTATQGQTLTASDTLADADGLGTVSYQWLRNGTSTGITGASYTLGQDDVDAKLSVTASYTDGQGTLEAITSAQTGNVANVNDAPTGGVTITGTATQGQTLIASDTLADADGLGTVSYQWLRNGTSTGITGASYTLGQADVGARLSVTASYTDAQGTLEAITSAQTGNIANINDAPTGGVTITGTATQGQTLTASHTLADVDGLGSITYQWLRNGTSTGITGASYTLGQADVGAKLSVTASYTDGQGTAEAITSAQTGNVASLDQNLSGTTGADNLIGGSGNDTLQGLAGNDTLTGNAGNDSLDGGQGNDTMLGGQGDDTYVVDATTDVVTENTNEGSDTVLSAVTYTVGNNVEKLTLTGTAGNSGTGNTLDNVLTGNSGANRLTGNAGSDTLIGGAGTDTLVGGAGNDVYVVDMSTDVITENANEGTDTVETAITFTIASLGNVENITLTGTAAVNATGNALANVLIGNSVANTLTGGTGADTLVGGGGNDIYVVDNTADLVTELAGEGDDLVQSAVTYTLSANVEQLMLTGTSAINGTGNAEHNTLTGNSGVNTLMGGAGNDTLNGGLGADSMVGGMGDDTYVVDNASEKTTENLNEGIDWIQSSVTWTLGANLENLTLTGSSAINGTGNTLDNTLNGNGGVNTLTGGAGNDLLNGGVGGDSMVGGMGNDTYVVENTADKTVENAGEGIDLVQSGITWTLGANLEDLMLTGTSAINGTGNTLANVLTGNGAANTLTGGGGNDTYRGGAGNDVLSATSTTSSDTYIWGRGEGADTLTDAGGTDQLQILASVSADQVWLRRASNNLEVSVIGGADKFTITNWYTAAANQVESFKLADGKTLTAANVQNLVNAMAAFTPPPVGQSSLTSNQHAALDGVIAANWT